MPALPTLTVAVQQPLAGRFVHPTWEYAQVLRIGTLLAYGDDSLARATRSGTLPGSYHRRFAGAWWSIPRDASLRRPS